MKKALEVSVVLSAVDRMNAAIDKATNQGIAKLERFQSRANAIADRSFKIGRNAAVVGLAMAAPIAYATNQAIKFEKEMANVAKVANVEIGSQAFKDLGDDAKKSAIYLGRSSEEAAGLMGNLLQGGVPLNQLAEITNIAGEMAVAFDMGADVAGNRFVKMNNALGYTYDQTRLVTDAMNHLSNNVATTGEQLLEFMFAGGAGSANRLGISGSDMSAIGAVFNQIGISSSEAATAVERMEKGIRSNTMMSGIFDASGGGTAGFMKILEVGSKLKGAEQFQFFRAFGEYGVKISALANNLDLVQKNLALVGDQSQYAGSAQQEFNNVAGTTAFRLAQQTERLNQLAILMGDSFLPVVIKFMEALSPMLESLNKWIQANPEVAGGIMKVMAFTAALSLTISGLAFAYGGLWKVLSVVVGPMLKFLGVTKWLNFQGFRLLYWIKFSLPAALTVAGGALKAFGVAVMSIPGIGWIIAAIAAIAGGAYLIYKNWDPIKSWFSNLWAGVTHEFDMFVLMVQNLGSRMYEAGANIVKSIGDGIASQWDAFIARWEKRIQQIRDFLPFSPAKVGPLQDIHKIKLVETIAQTITPGPVLSAMQGVAGAIAGPTAARPLALALAGRGGGGGIVLNYSPTISIAGGGNVREQIETLFRDHAKDLVRIFEQEIARRQRASF